MVGELQNTGIKDKWLKLLKNTSTLELGWKEIFLHQEFPKAKKFSHSLSIFSHPTTKPFNFCSNLLWDTDREISATLKIWHTINYQHKGYKEKQDNPTAGFSHWSSYSCTIGGLAENLALAFQRHPKEPEKEMITYVKNKSTQMKH